MTMTRFFSIALTLLLALALLPLPLLAADSPAGSDFVSATTAECLRRIDAKDYAGAQRLAIKLADGPQWKNGDLEAAGAIRAVVDAFRAAHKVELANQLLQHANQSHQATGYASIALQGWCLPEIARRGLPVLDGNWHIPMALKERSVNLLAFDPGTDLKRLRVGNQASVLKVMDPANRKVMYMRGLDGVMWAPVLEEHRLGIFTALGIKPSSLDQVANKLVDGYPTIRQKKECIALLGIIGSAKLPALSDATRRKLQDLLAKTMRGSKDVVLRRQACLSLALQDSLLPASVDAVVLFYEKSTNTWETFPVQQVFEYQQQGISLLPNRSQIRARIAAVKEIYTQSILKFL
jgi:hypothetical protein